MLHVNFLLVNFKFLLGEKLLHLTTVLSILSLQVTVEKELFCMRHLCKWENRLHLFTYLHEMLISSHHVSGMSQHEQSVA